MAPDLQRQHQSLLQDLRKKLLEIQTAGHKFDPMGWPTKMLQTEPRYELQTPAMCPNTKMYPCFAQLLIRLIFHEVNAFCRRMRFWLLSLFQHIREALQQRPYALLTGPRVSNASF